MLAIQHVVIVALVTIAVAQSTLDTTRDGTCGDGVSCRGSMWGGCCSADGKCGSTMDYCGDGCQLKYGYCDKTEGETSPDGTCAGETGFTCEGSNYGNCCSQYHFCGSTNEFCGTGCLDGFGDCSSNSTATSNSTITSNFTMTASKRSISHHTPPTAWNSSYHAANKTIHTTECGAKFRVEVGLDLVKGNVHWSGNGFKVDTFEECINACSIWPECVGVSWVDSHTFGSCYLKKHITSRSVDSSVLSAVLVKYGRKGKPTKYPALDQPPFGTTVSSGHHSNPSHGNPSHGNPSHGNPSQGNPSQGNPSQGNPSHSYHPHVQPSGLSSDVITASSAVSFNSYIKPSSISSNYVTVSTNSAMTTISAASSTAATHSTRISSSLATASASACAEQQQEESEEDCIPCDGQSGSLPYCGADVYTDHYKFTPKTCRTVHYELDITNGTVAPDGIERIAFLINGQMPGPKIEANWGDTIVVKVNNRLTANGTSMHWHGLRQLNTSEHDGVASITQCPIAPGDSFTYKFVASNYGTSWYHSHYAIQAWMGVFGPLVIHGPTSKKYDVDAGTIFLNDWTHTPVDALYDAEQDAVNGGPRTMDNGLINGMNTWGVQGTANQTGQRFELPTKFEPGKTYLLRIINGAIQSSYKFYLDGHTLEVINMDFTSIKPYKTDILSINIGQRYMVLVKADQPAGNYWMRADNQNACDETTQADDIKAIVRYSGGNSTAVPTTTKYNYTGECVDEPLASLVPIAPLNAASSSSNLSFVKDITVGVTSDYLFKWYLSGTTFMSHYEDPTLVRVLENGTTPTYSGDLILDLPEMGKWVYIVIESSIPLNHPIHLHGHDFFILAAGSGTYDSSTTLNLVNPPRRDTANMPAGGHLVLAFETDNPGTWLMHCHIGWHTSMGFALQLVEGKSMIKDVIQDKCALYDTCAKWDKWVEETNFYQHDSGV